MNKTPYSLPLLFLLKVKRRNRIWTKVKETEYYSSVYILFFCFICILIPCSYYFSSLVHWFLIGILPFHYILTLPLHFLELVPSWVPCWPLITAEPTWHSFFPLQSFHHQQAPPSNRSIQELSFVYSLLLVEILTVNNYYLLSGHILSIVY